jgi:AmmeMemoRadiSam system protein B/AmmeMemoRadiSam system protein A
MRPGLVLLFLIITVMDIHSQFEQTDRVPVVAGSFYPADKETLTGDLSVLFKNAIKSPGNNHVRAIIVPHAGYVFSGKIAASAFLSISRSAKYKNIFIIGSSHRVSFNGASVYNYGDFITPLGKAKVNREIGNQLIKSTDKFNNLPGAHSQEHSIEVQVPFIQYYFKSDVQIVPIVIGTDNINTIKEIAKALKPWFNKENLFVISSDFSHYPPYKDACEIDKITADAIISGNPETFQNTLEKNGSKNIEGLATSMCGWTSGLALLYLAQGDPDLKFIQIAYANSGDSSYGDKNEVVGYNAIALIENRPGDNADKTNRTIDFVFTQGEKEQLISIARESIKSMLYNKKRLVPDPTALPDIFKEPLGAFVTIKIGKELRGCIGRFMPSDPLYSVVIDMAVACAFEDSRFVPLTKEEFNKVNIEISVLSPLKKVTDIKEIVLGKNGIYIKKGVRSGTMLPQVATEQGWTLDEFLGYTSRDKAGLGWTGWKDAEIYTYEALVIEENTKK